LKLEFYDCDAKETFPIDLLVRVEGDFGENLGTFVLFLHHSGRVTEKNLKNWFSNLIWSDA